MDTGIYNKNVDPRSVCFFSQQFIGIELPFDILDSSNRATYLNVLHTTQWHIAIHSDDSTDLAIVEIVCLLFVVGLDSDRGLSIATVKQLFN